MPPLPSFNEYGVLPPGDYALGLHELEGSHLVIGAGRPAWDAQWRATLVANLSVCASVLWSVGVTEIYVDGSFVEDKAHPNDIDGYFVCDLRDFASGNFERRLNAADPNCFWTWNGAHRTPDPTSTKWQLPMWHRYRVELYPHYGDFPSGIKDKYGHDLPFPSAFRQQRDTYREKGIIRLIR